VVLLLQLLQALNSNVTELCSGNTLKNTDYISFEKLHFRVFFGDNIYMISKITLDIWFFLLFTNIIYKKGLELKILLFAFCCKRTQISSKCP